MPSVDSPLIVGAGPVGLAAALFLAHQGVRTRLVEKKQEPSRHSKALAVNPRTLELLESVNLTERMLATGTKIRGANLWRGGRVAATISFARLKHKYPFMLALSQASTERFLEEALAAQGGTVERGVQLTDCKNKSDGIAATLATPNGREVSKPSWMLAADGAHSTARERLGIDFPGRALRDKWYLADVALDTPLEEDRAHAFFLPAGEFQFMVRTVDPLVEATVRGRLWRVIGNRGGLLDRLAVGRTAGSPIWESDFQISHRMNRSLAAGSVFFAGDAAHIHSPIGARGMNLGIEDAWVFAQLVGRGQLHQYASLRYPIDRAVVRQVAAFSRIVTCEPRFLRIVRSLIPLFVNLGLPTARMMAIVTGTDHPRNSLLPPPEPISLGTHS